MQDEPCTIEVWQLVAPSGRLLAVCAQPLASAPQLGAWFPALPDGQPLYFDDGTTEIPGTAATGLILREVALTGSLWLLIVSNAASADIPALLATLDTASTDTDAGKASLWSEWSAGLGTSFATATAGGAPSMQIWGHVAASLGLPDALAQLLNGALPDGPAVSGSVDARQTDPELRLALALPGVSLFGTHVLDGAALSLTAPLSYTPDSATITLGGTVDLGDDRRIVLAVEIPESADTFLGHATYAEGSSPLLDPAGLGLPGSAATQSEAVELTLVFSGGGTHLDRIGVSLDLESVEALQSPRLALEQLRAELIVWDPFGDPMPTGSVDVSAVFGRITMSGHLSAPGGSAELALDGPAPSLDDVLGDLGVPTAALAELPDLTLTNADLSYDLATGTPGAQLSATATLPVGDNIALSLTVALTHSGGAWEHSFTAGLPPGQPLDIGTVIADAAQQTGIPAPPILDSLVLSELDAMLDSASGALGFTCAGTFDIGGEQLAMTIAIDRAKDAPQPFSGTLTAGQTQLAVTFAEHTLTAAWMAGASPVSLDEVAGALGLDLDELPAVLVPVLTSVTLSYTSDGQLTLSASSEHATLAFVSLPGPPRRSALVWDLGVTANLGDLPVVGSTVQAAGGLGLAGVAIVLAGSALTGPDIDAINAELPAGGKLARPDAGITDHVTLVVDLDVVGQTEFASLGFSSTSSSGGAPDEAPNEAPTTATALVATTGTEAAQPAGTGDRIPSPRRRT